MADTAPVAIVAAWREELAPLCRRVSDRRREDVGGVPTTRGRLGGIEVACAVTGDGARQARARVDDLLGAARFEALIGVGLAGGLAPDLAWGTVLAAERVTDADGPAPAPDATWLERAEAVAIVRRAPMLSAPHLAATPAAKRRLRDASGGAAWTVDLESAAFARAAHDHGVPYLGLRAVSDSAGEALPAWLVACEDEDGHVSRIQILRGALARPWRLVPLLHLAHRTRTCAKRLADAVQHLLAPTGT